MAPTIVGSSTVAAFIAGRRQVRMAAAIVAGVLPILTEGRCIDLGLLGLLRLPGALVDKGRGVDLGLLGLFRLLWTLVHERRGIDLGLRQATCRAPKERPLPGGEEALFVRSW
jgi:hypothetical protein